MKIRMLLSGCVVLATMILSGCADMQLNSSAKGKTWDQMVAMMRPIKQDSQDGVTYYCYSCASGPTRTYTNAAGNTVAVYLFWNNYDYSAHCSSDGYYDAYCTPAYSKCKAMEKRFEFQNNVIVRAWHIISSNEPKYAPYTNACASTNPEIIDSKEGF
ncbi:MAG: hypothetical protein LBE24_08270 [Methylobacillus sp.]|jgi:hypothetical protein|nr:hypothetical protein [Methylobacillus sp.]